MNQEDIFLFKCQLERSQKGLVDVFAVWKHESLWVFQIIIINVHGP